MRVELTRCLFSDMSPLVGGNATSVVNSSSKDLTATGGITTLEDMEKKSHLTMAYLTLAKASPDLFETMGMLIIQMPFQDTTDESIRPYSFRCLLAAGARLLFR